MSKRGALRASDADRDQVVDRLHKAATEGRIGSDELEHRVSTALKARTYAELDATVADLPSPRGRRGGPPARRTAPQWALATVRSNPWLILFAIPIVGITFAMLVTAAVLWTMIAVVALVVGGRPPLGRAVWTHSRRRVSPPRRGPGSYWA
ncbi:MAG: DUF1707 domain-containing protein [Solirubrobacteraceae bacterium]